MVKELNKLTAIILLVTLLFVLFNPIVSHANDGGMGDFNVELKGGNLTIKGDGFDEEKGETANRFLGEYKTLATVAIGASAVTFLISLVILFMKVSVHSDDARRRKEAVSGIGWTLFATAGTGVAVTIIGLAFNFFGGKK